MQNEWGHWKGEAAVILVLMIALCATAASAEEPASRKGQWSLGGELGFISHTPERDAFAMNIRADRFNDEFFSLGPLLQLGLNGDLQQIALSGQFKYWHTFGLRQPTPTMTLQAGFGFVHADAATDSDTSWIIPLGIGFDYPLADRLSLSSTLLLNITHLEAGSLTGAVNIMPSITVGLRF